MGHHHHDDDHHHHHHEPQGPLTDTEKLAKRLQHWISHNDDHVAGYDEWSRKAAETGYGEISRLLKEAAEATAAVTRLFEEALRALK